MKNIIKKSNTMSFKTKGLEAKVGKTLITRRPYAKITVSEDMMYLGAAVSVGIPLAVAGAKQVGKMGKAAVSKVSGIFSKKAPAAEEDFMEQ